MKFGDLFDTMETGVMVLLVFFPSLDGETRWREMSALHAIWDQSDELLDLNISEDDWDRATHAGNF